MIERPNLWLAPLVGALTSPLGFSLLLLGLAWLLRQRRPQLAWGLVLGTLGVLYALATPWLAYQLQQAQELGQPISAAQLQQVDAIVVLGAGGVLLRLTRAAQTPSATASWCACATPPYWPASRASRCWSAAAARKAVCRKRC